jgi:type IV pilus assembly protein PilW
MTFGRSRQRGMTLIELMVAATLGLFLVAVMGTIYLGSKGTFLSQDSMARLQENGRFAIDTIGADLRMAGFRGCLGAGKTTAAVNTLNSASSSLYNFGIGLGASHNIASAWAPALDTAISSLTPAPSAAGDVLTIRRPVGQGWALTAEMPDDVSALTVGAPAAFQTGDLLMVTDCNGAAVFQASNANPGSSGSIQHLAGGGLVPGMTSNSLGRAFLQDALVYRMETVTYYLAPSARTGRAGVMSLWSFTNPSYDGTPQPAEIVTGVQSLAVKLGLDTDGDRNADQYLPPDAVTDWSSAVSARIELLFASPQDNITTAPQKYTFDGSVVTPTDRKLRTTMTLVSSLRNSLP